MERCHTEMIVNKEKSQSGDLYQCGMAVVTLAQTAHGTPYYALW